MAQTQPAGLATAQTLPATSVQTPTIVRHEAVRNIQPRASKPLQRPEDEKHSFEGYVENVVAKSVSIFGKDLFQDVPDTFAPVDSAQVNPDYTIGAGDELQIRAWGMIDVDVSVTVDRGGSIYIPRVGVVRVAGVRYRDLQGYLRQAVSKVFTNFDLTVSVAQTRAVQVYVVGHAVRPGTYTLSAMSTLLNALFISGGPEGSGTMRNIQLKRGGKTVTTFDLYDMLVHGDKSRDVALQDGDVIHIPPVGPLVALTGDVKKPAIFELKGAASVADVLTWAGGFDSPAEQRKVVVEKNVANNFQPVAELVADQAALSGPLASIPVLPADIVRVFSPAAVPVQAKIQREYVRVSGEVAQSGVFEIRKGESLRELVARLGGATENGYLYGMSVSRDSVRRSQQERLDEIAERFEREIEAVASERLSRVTEQENIAAVTAEAERQRQLAQRLRSIRATGRIVLELPGEEAQVKHLPDLALQNGDTIHIPRRPGTVDVFGAVFQQNSFIYRPRRLVRDYLELAGGGTRTADASQIYVIRADGTTQSASGTGWLGGMTGIGGEQINPGDTIVVPEALDRQSWTRTLKEWTTILYQFGLGAAGLKVLKD